MCGDDSKCQFIHSSLVVRLIDDVVKCDTYKHKSREKLEFRLPTLQIHNFTLRGLLSRG